MNFLTRLFDTEGFPARWNCGQGWKEDSTLGWVHVGSDLVTWLAYMLIPCVLGYFVLKRKDIVFQRVFWLFGMFIFACGTVHLIEAIIFWQPIYRFSAVVKIITAVVSAATVIALFRIAPVAVSLPGLQEVNKELEDQIREKEKVEKQLRESNQELITFTNNLLDREDRVIALKKEVNELLEQTGNDARYAIDS